jgi:hypothetical protein
VIGNFLSSLLWIDPEEAFWSAPTAPVRIRAR